MGVLPACVSVHHEHAWCQQKAERAADLLELELAVKRRVGARSHARVPPGRATGPSPADSSLWPLFFLRKKYLICISVCACMIVCRGLHMCVVWVLECNTWELLLSFHHVGIKAHTRVMVARAFAL